MARNKVKKRAVPWLRRLAAGLSLRKPVLNSRPVHVQFVGDNVALRQGVSPNTFVFRESEWPNRYRDYVMGWTVRGQIKINFFLEGYYYTLPCVMPEKFSGCLKPSTKTS
jgi:hypothetical protein